MNEKYEKFKSQFHYDNAPFHRLKDDESFFVDKTTGNCLQCLVNMATITCQNYNNIIREKEGCDYRINVGCHVDFRNFRIEADILSGEGKKRLFQLSAGVYFAVADLCSSLVHRPEFLDKFLTNTSEYTICLYQNRKEDGSYNGWLKDYSWLTSTEKNAKTWNPLICSKTFTPRAVIGDFLIKRCLFWIFSHEIAHLLLDHADIVKKIDFDNDNVQASRQFHVLEYEADAMASCADIDIENNINELTQSFERAKVNSIYDGEWPEPNDELIIRLFLLVPFIVSMLFVRKGNRESFKHPRPIFRVHNSANALAQNMSLYLGKKINWFNEIMDQDFAAVAAVCIHNELLRKDFYHKWINPEYGKDFNSFLSSQKEFVNKFGMARDRAISNGLRFKEFENFMGEL